MKPTRIFFAITLICCLQALNVWGDIDYSYKVYTSADGLPSNDIHEILQDNEGYIWFASTGGLARFDGYSFLVFNDFLNYGMGSNTVHVGKIILDKHTPFLWLITSLHRVGCLNLTTYMFEDYTQKKDLSRQFGGGVYCPSSGIWFSHKVNGIRNIKIKDKEFVCQDYSLDNGLLPGFVTFRAIEDINSNVWISTDNGLVRIDTLGRTSIELEHTPIIMGCRYDKDMIFLTSDYNIVKIGKQTKTYFTPLLKDGDIQVLSMLCKQDRVSIFTTGTTFELNLTTGIFQKAEYQLPGGKLQQSIDDYSLVANEKGELLIFGPKGNPEKLELMLTKEIHTMKSRLYTACLQGDSLLCIATMGNGLFFYDVKKHKIIKHYTSSKNTHNYNYASQNEQSLLPTNNLQYIFRDRQGNIWVSCQMGGVICLSPKSNIKTERDLLSTDGKYLNGIFYDSETKIFDVPVKNIYAIIKDHKGKTWLGTWGYGLVTNNAKYLTDEVNTSRIRALALTRDGQLYIASNNGLYVVDTNNDNINSKSFKIYNTQNKNLHYDELTSLLIDSNGILWIGSFGGGIELLRIEKDAILEHLGTINHEVGLPNNIIRAMIEDKKGNVWVATEQDIACVNQQTHEVRGYRPIPTLQQNIYKENGGRLLEDGKILFETETDAIIIDNNLVTNATDNNSFFEQIEITDIRINGRSIYSNEQLLSQCVFGNGGNLSLSYDQNSLQFYFSDFNFSNENISKYQYKLSKIDNNWYPATTLNTAIYDNLSPGTYYFQIRHYVKDKWEEAKPLKIVINQPWYNTWIAWTVYVLAGLIIAYIFLYQVYRNFKLKQKIEIENKLNDFRISFFTNITHEFRSPIAIISNATERINRTNNDSNSADLQAIQRGVGRMSRLVNELITYRKLTKGEVKLSLTQGDIIAFIHNMYIDVYGMAKEKNLNMSFVPFAKKYIMFFDTMKVEAIFYNLIDNAIKYTPKGGSIEVVINNKTFKGNVAKENPIDIEKQQKSIIITVTDNGPGIKGNQLDNLFVPFMHGYVSQGGIGIGLFSAKRLSEIHHGSLIYESATPEGGARFVFTLPASEEIYDLEEFDNDEEKIDKPSNETINQYAEEIIRDLVPKALNKEKVAIIEDDVDLMRQIQSEVGVYFEVEGYLDGKEGYKKVIENPPSLLICDIRLPNMDGYEIVKRLKNDERFTYVPVIMLTSFDSEEHRMKGYKAGADDYIVKPCNFKFLIARTLQLITWTKKMKISVKTSSGVEINRENDKEENAVLFNSIQDRKFKERLDALIIHHLADNISVDEMATLLNFGHTKFYGKVKELTGMSPNKYIMNERLKVAAELLLEGQLNIGEITHKTGFCDQAYFNRCFKQKYGVSPSAYGKISNKQITEESN